jgi:hypothetical protein
MRFNGLGGTDLRGGLGFDRMRKILKWQDLVFAFDCTLRWGNLFRFGYNTIFVFQNFSVLVQFYVFVFVFHFFELNFILCNLHIITNLF